MRVLLVDRCSIGRSVKRHPEQELNVTLNAAFSWLATDPRPGKRFPLRAINGNLNMAGRGRFPLAHHTVSGDGHRAMEAWVLSFGPVVRWGIEGAASWGRHTAMFLCNRGHDVRDVCPNRTHVRDKARQRGKSDTLDSERIARETLAHPLLPLVFKRSGAGEAGADEDHELLAIWHGARRSCSRAGNTW